MIEPVEQNPALIRLNEIVAHCEKRCARADERLACVERERADASISLTTAIANRDAWIEANPDPQMELI